METEKLVISLLGAALGIECDEIGLDDPLDALSLWDDDENQDSFVASFAATFVGLPGGDDDEVVEDRIIDTVILYDTLRECTTVKDLVTLAESLAEEYSL